MSSKLTDAQVRAFQTEVAKQLGFDSIMIKQDDVEFVPLPYKLDDDNHMVPTSEKLGDYHYAYWVHMRRINGEWTRAGDTLCGECPNPQSCEEPKVKFREFT